MTRTLLTNISLEARLLDFHLNLLLWILIVSTWARLLTGVHTEENFKLLYFQIYSNSFQFIRLSIARSKITQGCSLIAVRCSPPHFRPVKSIIIWSLVFNERHFSVSNFLSGNCTYGSFIRWMIRTRCPCVKWNL